MSLTAFLHEVLGFLEARPFSTDNKKPTLNRLVTKMGLTALAEMQILRYSFFFVRDTLPSDTSKTKIRRLLKGKRIALGDPYLKCQGLTNRMHSLCISSVRQRATGMHKIVKGALIDFSETELPAPKEIVLSEDDLNWIRTVLPVHGFLRRCDAHLFEFEEDVNASPDGSLKSFWNDCCVVERGVAAPVLSCIKPTATILMSDLTSPLPIRKLARAHIASIPHVTYCRRKVWTFLGLRLNYEPILSANKAKSGAQHVLYSALEAYASMLPVEMRLEQ